MRDKVRNNALLSIEILIATTFFMIFAIIAIGIGQRAKVIAIDNADSSMALSIAIRLAEEFKRSDGNLNSIELGDASSYNVEDNKIVALYSREGIEGKIPNTQYECIIELDNTLYNNYNNSYKEAAITVYKVDDGNYIELVKLDSAVICGGAQEDMYE